MSGAAEWSEQKTESHSRTRPLEPISTRPFGPSRSPRFSCLQSPHPDGGTGTGSLSLLLLESEADRNPLTFAAIYPSLTATSSNTQTHSSHATHAQASEAGCSASHALLHPSTPMTDATQNGEAAENGQRHTHSNGKAKSAGSMDGNDGDNCQSSSNCCSKCLSSCCRFICRPRCQLRTLLCCFACLTCCGCRDKVCQRLVFFPPQPFYALSDRDGEQTMWLVEEGRRIEPYSSPDMHVAFISTRRASTICTMWIRHPGAETTVLFSHGNATDIGCMRDHMLDFSRQLQVNVMIYDYTGYGLSSGAPTMADTLADSEAAYDYLTRTYPISCKRVIAYGQSLGSGPTIHLSRTRRVSGAIIHAGLMSGLRVIQPPASPPASSTSHSSSPSSNPSSTPSNSSSSSKSHWFDIFPNVDWIRSTRAPVFVIHGSDDSEIPFEHGVGLSQAAGADTPTTIPPIGWQNEAEDDDVTIGTSSSSSGNGNGNNGHMSAVGRSCWKLWRVAGAGHNNIEVEYRDQLFEHLRTFVKYIQQHTVTLDEMKPPTKTMGSDPIAHGQVLEMNGMDASSARMPHPPSTASRPFDQI